MSRLFAPIPAKVAVVIGGATLPMPSVTKGRVVWAPPLLADCELVRPISKPNCTACDPCTQLSEYYGPNHTGSNPAKLGPPLANRFDELRYRGTPFAEVRMWPFRSTDGVVEKAFPFVRAPPPGEPVVR